MHAEGDGGLSNACCLGEGASPYILLALPNGYFPQWPFCLHHKPPPPFLPPLSLFQAEFILSPAHCGE